MIHARPDYQGRIVDLAGLIPDDEPVMFIRGQDAAAIPAINEWIRAAEAAGASHEMLALVALHRERIRAWQGHTKKTPDLPTTPQENPR